MRRQICILSLVFVHTLGLAYVGRAQSAAVPADSTPSWSSLAEQCREAGLPDKRVQTVLRSCKNSGLSPDSAAELLSPVREAVGGGISPEPILNKIEEGLGKKVAWEKIRTAAGERVRFTLRAKELVASHYTRDPKSAKLTLSTAYALEAGVPEPDIAAVFRAGASKRETQLQGVVEAGESLHLAGLRDEMVKDLMMDCLNRDLRPVEMSRVVRFAREQHSSGATDAVIRDALWGKDSTRGGGNASPEGAQGQQGRIGIGAESRQQDQDAGPSGGSGSSPGTGAGPGNSGSDGGQQGKNGSARGDR